MYHFGEFGYVALFQGSSSVFRLHSGQECEFEIEEGLGIRLLEDHLNAHSRFDLASIYIAVCM